MTKEIAAENKKRKLSFPVILLLGIILGSLFGVFFPEKSKVLKPLGDIFLNLMFTAVVPMVFVSIATAVGNMANMSRLRKILFSTLLTFIGTGLIASVYVFIAVKLFPPAVGTKIALQSTAIEETKSAADLLVSSFTVPDFVNLLSRRNMLPLIIFATLFGFCVSHSGGQESPVGKILNHLNDIMMKLINVIMWYAPIGLGAYFASLIGEFGPDLIGDYGRTLLIYYPLCVLYFFTAFPCYAFLAGGKEGLR
ncbi:dicarboxylate/amino acid:cation symporter, partial [Fusobacterium necrophorum]